MASFTEELVSAPQVGTALNPPPEEVAFPHQTDLPPLPLPSLADTCDRYLDTVRPLLSETELLHTQSLLADFCKEGGVGNTLQQMLEERAGSERNWIEEWWEQLAYLRTRTTMAVHINWFGVMPEWGIRMTNVQAAAAMLNGLLEFRTGLHAGKFPPETLMGNPLDMHQFLRVFGTTRVPQEGQDEIVQVADSQHIIIMRENAMVSVPLYTAAGAPLSLRQLQAQLARALELAAPPLLEKSDNEPLSVLTSLPRDEWAAQRTSLLADPSNAEALQAVESALFCISFETGAPTTKQEAAEACLCGAGRNKWFDKSFTVVIFENGRGGLNAEHTPVDAMTIVSMFMSVNESVRASIRDVVAVSPADLLSEHVPAPPPAKVTWSLSAPLLRTMEHASVGIARLGGDVHMRILEFAHFGKRFLKSTRLHPDMFMQMAIQLAYFRLHGNFVATYETGHTRAFYHGRTDTIRTLSLASCDFARSMDDATLAPHQRLAKLKAACKVHGEQMKRVLTGQGIDRHLLGLMVAAHLAGESPALFSDPAFKRSGGGGNFTISTSNVGYTPLFGGFSPMTADGYGVCYAMLEGRMNVAVTAWRSEPTTCADRMHDALIDALVDMQLMCKDAGAGAPTPTASKL